MITTYPLTEFLALELPAQEFVVDGLLIRGEAVLLSAREKSGKGLLMVDAAVSIASGETFLGRATTQGSVLYLALEESQRTLQKRFSTRANGDHILPIGIVPLDGSMDQTFSLHDPDSIAALRDLILERAATLVILDPLREARTEELRARLREIAGPVFRATAADVRARIGVVSEIVRNDASARCTRRGRTRR